MRFGEEPVWWLAADGSAGAALRPACRGAGTLAAVCAGAVGALTKAGQYRRSAESSLPAVTSSRGVSFAGSPSFRAALFGASVPKPWLQATDARIPQAIFPGHE